jgi:glucan-binding YG repeat protein
MKKLLGILVLVLAVSLACTAFAESVGEELEVPDDGRVVAWGQLDLITKIHGHKIHQPYIEFKDSSCSEFGRATFDCEVTSMGIHQHYVLIEKKDHTMSSTVDGEDWGKVIEKPTCDKEGYAVDYCIECGYVDEDHVRTIEKTHSYSDKVYEVVKAATCTETGLGQHKCIYCGELNPNEVDENGKYIEEKLVVIPLIDHDFTDWNITKGTCAAYGTAERACLICGMHQVVDGSDKDNDLHMQVTINNTTTDRVIDNLKELGLTDIDKLNQKWEQPKVKEYDSEAKYQDWLNEFNKKLDKAAKVTKNRLVDCYTREITLSCPYCCKDGNDAKSFHKNIVITLKAPATVAHVWDMENVQVERKPSCAEPGFKVYYCVHNADHEKAVPNITAKMTLKEVYEELKKDDYFIWDEKKLVKVADPRVKIVEVAKTGHTWSDWKVANTYTKDGVKYVMNVRICEVCGEKEEELKPLTEKDGKNGLVLNEKTGEWEFYEADKLVKETKIVGFNDGEFWIVDGKLAKACMGLVFCADEKFYFLNQGQILRVSEIVEYDGGWFIVKNGELDLDATGLYTYDGGRFLFTAGRLRKDVSGLVEVNGTWYFLANGQVADYTGVAEYDGEFFVIDNGLLDADYNGTIEYDGATFDVVNGQLYAQEAAE